MLLEPVIDDWDLLVQVKVVAVNPVETKLRTSVQPDQAGVKVFAVGDCVFYAGDITRVASGKMIGKIVLAGCWK